MHAAPDKRAPPGNHLARGALAGQDQGHPPVETNRPRSPAWWYPPGEGLHAGSLAELGLGHLGQLPLLVKCAGRGQAAIFGQQHQPGGVGGEQDGGRGHDPVQAPRQPSVGVQVGEGADALGQVGRVDAHTCPLPGGRRSATGWEAWLVSARQVERQGAREPQKRRAKALPGPLHLKGETQLDTTPNPTGPIPQRADHRPPVTHGRDDTGSPAGIHAGSNH